MISWQCDESIFFFCSLFFWENYIWSPCFLFTTELLWWNYFLNDFRLLVGLLRLACLLSASRMYNLWWEIIFNKSLYYFHIVHQPISSLNTFPFLFPLNFSLIISLSLSLLTLEISVILFPSFWLFVVLFCMLWMLVTVNKVTDMACCLTNFLSNSFSESNEIGPILVTPSLGNEWWKNGKKNFWKSLQKWQQEGKREKRQEVGENLSICMLKLLPDVSTLPSSLPDVKT